MNYVICLLTVVAGFVFGTQAVAAPISADSIIGRYSVEASVPFRKVKIDFKVVNSKEFEITQIDKDGKPEETCNGTYEISASLDWTPIIFADGKMFKGVFTCPSDRSKDVDFDIDFQDKTTEDLVKGTSVVVTTSLAPMKIKATVKKISAFELLY